jgi:hypothetical protein
MLGYESEVVNGQLVNVAPAPAYDPIIWGPAYVGPNGWPRQGVYNVPPVMPSPELQQTMAPGSYGATAPSTVPFPTAMSEKGNPFHLTKSPVIWVIVLLIFSLAMLQYVHFGH